MKTPSSDSSQEATAPAAPATSGNPNFPQGTQDPETLETARRIAKKHLTADVSTPIEEIDAKVPTAKGSEPVDAK